MIFLIRDSKVLDYMIGHINGISAKGIVPHVVVSEKKEDRSLLQNNLFHQWIADIALSTGHGKEYESGRIKYQYFLPVLARSENEKCRLAADSIRLIETERGFATVLLALGHSVIQSTRLLSVKEFSEALRSMQLGEARHNLTNPDLRGWKVWHR